MVWAGCFGQFWLRTPGWLLVQPRSTGSGRFMNQPFRPLAPRELELLEKLLEPEFPGRDELQRQLGSVTARQTHDDGTLELHCEGGPQAPVGCRVPTEGEYLDAGGRPVNGLLPVKSVL